MPPPMPTEGGVPKLPPPFPVVAPPATGKTTPPIPHMAGPMGEVVVEEKPTPAKAFKRKSGKKGLMIGALAAVVVLGAGGYFAWPMIFPPPPVAVKPKPAVATPVANAPAVTSAAATKPASAGPATPSDTLNNLAHAPVNAINKAQDAVTARRQVEQARVDAIASGQEPAVKPATKVPPVVIKPAVNASATLSPGVTATTSDVEAVADSTPAFRAFVANAKVSSVIGGTSPKLTINGRLIRAGEMADASLGIIFEGTDPEKKLLIFKDKTGAVVTKRY